MSIDKKLLRLEIDNINSEIQFILNDLPEDIWSWLQGLVKCRDTEVLLEFQDKIDEKYGVDKRYDLLASLSFRTIISTLESETYSYKISGQIEKYWEEDILRLIKLSLKRDVNFLDFNNPLSIFYLMIASYVAFPVEHQMLAVSGFPRRLIAKQTLGKAIDFLSLLVTCGGNEPYFEMHYNPYKMRRFNPDGWRKLLIQSGELLALNKGVKGIFGRSWFFDPQLKDISPELSYIRDILEEAGGRFYFSGHTDEDRSNAFAFSKKRKTAFEEGKYNPAGYMVVLPRRVLVKGEGS